MGAIMFAYGAIQVIHEFSTTFNIYESWMAAKVTTSTLMIFGCTRADIIFRHYFWWRAKLAIFHAIMITSFISRTLKRWIFITLRTLISILLHLLGQYGEMLLYWIAIISSIVGLMYVEFSRKVSMRYTMHFVRRGFYDKESVIYFEKYATMTSRHSHCPHILWFSVQCGYFNHSSVG